MDQHSPQPQANIIPFSSNVESGGSLMEMLDNSLDKLTPYNPRTGKRQIVASAITAKGKIHTTPFSLRVTTQYWIVGQFKN